MVGTSGQWSITEASGLQFQPFHLGLLTPQFKLHLMLDFFERMRKHSRDGISVLQRCCGNGNLTTRAGLFLLSYHQGLDRFCRSNLGLGLQTGYVAKRVNEGDLIFEQQWMWC